MADPQRADEERQAETVERARPHGARAPAPIVLLLVPFVWLAVRPPGGAKG